MRNPISTNNIMGCMKLSLSKREKATTLRKGCRNMTSLNRKKDAKAMINNITG